MSSIRVSYSGLISLLVSIIAVFTGTVFILIVSRNLSPEELGTWTLINSLVGYILIIDPIVSYWNTRQIARGEQIGKSALFITGFFSAGGILAYLVMSFFVSETLPIDFSILLLATALVPLNFFRNTLSGIAYGTKPHYDQYGLVAFEITKIPLGFLFVVVNSLGLYGAILAIIFSNIVRVVFLSIILREHLYGEIKRQVIKFWFKMSWLPMYSVIPGFIITLDVLIFSTMSNSLIGLAYWTAGITIAAFIAQSGSFSRALYPKLIATRNKIFAEENLQRSLYFIIPSLALSIIFAKPLLHIINPIYTDGVIIVYFLTLRVFVQFFINFSFNVMRAFDQVDTNLNASFKQYFKSKLFFIPTLTLVLSGMYIGTLILMLILRPTDWTDIELVQAWSIIFFGTHAPFAIYGLILIRKNYKIKMPLQNILKYSLVTLLASSILYYFTENYITYYTSIWEFLPEVIPLLALGGVIYFGLTYLIDYPTRKFLNSIFSEIYSKK